MQALLKRFGEILSKLDAIGGGEELEEFCAELEDAIFLLECAEDGEEVGGALDELEGLTEELRMLGEAEHADELFATVGLARRSIRVV